MALYDVDLDFSGGKLNYFSTDHCEGKVVYWPSAATAIVPFQFDSRHVTFLVTLDGHTVKAMMDTGAPRTTLSAVEALRIYGITADSPGAKVLDDDGKNKTLGYVFGNLSFEGLAVTHASVIIMPDLVGSKDVNNDYVTGSRVHRVDDRDSADPIMLIGMDILSKLHVYIAFGEKRLYITPAAQPAAPQPTTAEAKP